jgi:hypothetical protein
MMRPTILLLSALLGLAAAHAQVTVDRPLRFTAADSTLRQVEGIAPAVSGDALLQAGAGRGIVHLAQAGGTAMAVTLVMEPPCTAYVSGLKVRWTPVAQGAGLVTLNVDGLGARRLYRSDGLPVDAGALAVGSIAEAVYQDTAFFLQHRQRTTCPDGYLPVNASLCIQRNDTLNTSIFNAVKWCSDRGARLCTWDEYIAACTAQQGALIDLFDNWEWMDDTSDHTHTANQAGRWQCRSQRAIGAVDHPNNYGSVRCCLWRK